MAPAQNTTVSSLFDKMVSALLENKSENMDDMD